MRKSRFPDLNQGSDALFAGICYLSSTGFIAHDYWVGVIEYLDYEGDDRLGMLTCSTQT
ncbi:MAG: hypothetical protein ACOYVJ_02620 [Nitrospirota bacterium]